MVLTILSQLEKRLGSTITELSTTVKGMLFKENHKLRVFNQFSHQLSKFLISSTLQSLEAISARLSPVET